MQKKSIIPHYKKIIAIIIIYSYLILAYKHVLNLEMLGYTVAIIILLYTVYSNWRIKGLDNPDSFEYLWKNDKIGFICNLLIVLSIIIAILI